MKEIWTRLSFRQKTLFLLIGSMIPIWLIVIGYVLPLMKNNMFEDRKAAVKNTIDVATSIIKHYHTQAKNNQLTEDEAKARAFKAIEALRYSGNEYFWINDLHPKMVMHPIKPEMNGTDLSQYKDPKGKALFVEAAALAKGEKGEGFIDYMWAKPGSPNPEPKISFVRGFAPWQWVVGSGVYVDDIEKAVFDFRMKVIVGFIAALTIAFFVFYFFTGRLMNILSKTVNETTEAGEQVLTASNMLATAGQNVAQGATESAMKIEESNTSVSALNDIVVANKSRAQAAADLAHKSEVSAEKGMKEMKELMTAINGMAKTSEEITKAMSIIDDIAFQTNLLALNAAVEAARAGEQGKGFAVVADAVRGLASKSADAAKEVQAVVQNSIEQSISSQKLARQSDEALEQILKSVKQVSILNQEISESTLDQSNGIQTIQKAMKALEDQSHTFAAAAEETAATSEEMSSQAKNFQSLVNLIANEVNGQTV